MSAELIMILGVIAAVAIVALFCMAEKAIADTVIAHRDAVEDDIRFNLNKQLKEQEIIWERARMGGARLNKREEIRWMQGTARLGKNVSKMREPR